MTNPIIAGDVNPSAPSTLGASGLNIPGVQLPTTTDAVNAINAVTTKVGPGHFTQLTVDGQSAFNGPVYFGASQHTAWFDCSPATVDPTVVLDFAGGPQQYLFLTRNTIVWLPTTDQQEGMFFVMVQQDAVGGWDLTWKINNPTTDGSAVVYWLTGAEPVMGSAAGAVRLYTFAWCQNLNGGLGAYVGSSTLGGVVVGPASATDNAIVRFDAATGRLVQNSAVTIDDAGNVGIGTATPGATLHINNDSWGAEKEVLRIGNTSVSDYFHSIKAKLSTDVNDDYIAFVLSNATSGNQAEVMRLKGNGNVGIGTTNPVAKLHVVGNTQIVGQAHIGQYSNGTAYIDAYGGFAYYGCDNQNGISISAAGNASIGNNLYVGGNMSALTITDRTPVYEGDALAELVKIKGKDGKIDHSTLPAFARHVTTLQVASETEKDKDGKAVMIETQEEGRDLGAMISMLTVAVKQLNDRLVAVENK